MKKSLTAERPAWIPLVPTPYGPNALCLELANKGSDGLPDLESFLKWSQDQGVLDPPTISVLKNLAVKKPAAAKKAIQRVRTLRDSIFRVFSAIAAGKPVPKSDLALLNGEFAASAPKLNMQSRNGEFRLVWSEAASHLDSPIWPVAVSAAELLTSPLLSRVRECASPTCAWLFLDVSKNSSRRWCDMLSCGNRAKAKRFHERHRDH